MYNNKVLVHNLPINLIILLLVSSSLSIISLSTIPHEAASTRCPNGYRESPSGDCERDVELPGDLPRCPNGYHRSPDGDCERVAGSSSSSAAVDSTTSVLLPSPSSHLPQCEIFTFTVEGTTNLANARENIDDANTDLTFEVNSILNPYNGHIRNDDLVSGKLWIDKDKNNEKELDFNVKEISNDCKVIAYLDDEHNEDDN
jgi:hypothetical protein